MKYRTPVILLTDGYLANGAEPWLLPDVDALPDISRAVRDRAEPRPTASSGRTSATPRRWPARGRSPARPASMHRIGGIEKEDGTGNISYDPENHEHMVAICGPRRSPASPTTSRSATRRPTTAPRCSWSAGAARGVRSTAGVRPGARPGPQGRATRTSMHLNPFPRDLGEVLRRYPKVLVPEMNLGQLSRLIRAEYLVDAQSFTKMQGVPFRAGEMEHEILEMLDNDRRRWRLTASYPQGLPVRPGGPLVPRVRRLRDPRRDPVPAARARA